MKRAFSIRLQRKHKAGPREACLLRTSGQSESYFPRSLMRMREKSYTLEGQENIVLYSALKPALS